jgi:hypothetical protein
MKVLHNIGLVGVGMALGGAFQMVFGGRDWKGLIVLFLVSALNVAVGGFLARAKR